MHSYLIFANSLLMRFSSSSLALAFRKSAINVTRPAIDISTVLAFQALSRLTAHRLVVALTAATKNATSTASGRYAHWVFWHLDCPGRSPAAVYWGGYLIGGLKGVK